MTDVGQGTALVINSREAVMLYDTGGESFTGRPVIERGFVRWLRQNGISTIDLLVVSHGDADHAGGLAEIRKHFDIQSHYGFGGNSKPIPAWTPVSHSVTPLRLNRSLTAGCGCPN